MSGRPALSSPISLSTKRQRSSASVPPSNRIPAPLPVGMRAPRNSTWSICTSGARTTRIALPSACRQAASMVATPSGHSRRSPG
jgi:hypothetical protein